jgi:hypothetical protein
VSRLLSGSQRTWSSASRSMVSTTADMSSPSPRFRDTASRNPRLGPDPSGRKRFAQKRRKGARSEEWPIEGLIGAPLHGGGWFAGACHVAREDPRSRRGDAGRGEARARVLAFDVLA